MEQDKIFVDGLIVKPPHENAPEFVKLRLSMKVGELTAFLLQHQRDGWVNCDIKVSKGGKIYAELDTWQPTQGQAATRGIEVARQAVAEPPAGMVEDDIPFAPFMKGEF